jgi:PAS domain S-box-containing protein
MNAAERDRLEDEIAALKDRVHELEGLRDAVSSGAVDAFVVGREEDRKRVLLLSGAYGRYRQLVEDMEQGAVTITESGDILFLNQSLAALLLAAPSDLFRQPFLRYVGPADAKRFEAFMSRRGRDRQIQVSLRRSDGQLRLVRVSMIDNHDDFTTLIVTDIGPKALVAAQPGGPTLPPELLRVTADLSMTLGLMRVSLGYLRTFPGVDEKGRGLIEALDRQTSDLFALMQDFRANLEALPPR